MPHHIDLYAIYSLDRRQPPEALAASPSAQKRPRTPRCAGQAPLAIVSRANLPFAASGSPSG